MLWLTLETNIGNRQIEYTYLQHTHRYRTGHRAQGGCTNYTALQNTIQYKGDNSRSQLCVCVCVCVTCVVCHVTVRASLQYVSL